jgi:hypothetical protein
MNRDSQRERRRVPDAGRRRCTMRQPRPRRGIGDLLEFQQDAVAAQVAHVPAAPLCLGFQYVRVEGSREYQCPRLVIGHQARVPYDIGEHDHGIVTFSALFGARRACRWLHIRLQLQIGAPGR